MSTSTDRREIPEEVFRHDFGGSAFDAELAERRRTRTRVLALVGLLTLITAPMLLFVAGWALVKMRYCAWGLLC